MEKIVSNIVDEIKNIAYEAQKEISLANTNEELNNIRIKYLGRKGRLTSILKKIKEIPASERPYVGRVGNEIKAFLEKELKEKIKKIKEEEKIRKIEEERIDITLPGRKNFFGRFHPINLVLEEIIEIFTFLGFEVEEGPEIEFDYYNFEALNIPKDHPARDMHDTFYIRENVLLRTHTSPVQIRVMERKKPPIQMIAFGKVYRRDADISHTPMFHQVEGLMVDENISFSNLKWVLTTFLKALFSKNVKVRFRPSYFPFTEPSVEVDIGCVVCKGEGCRVCKGTGYLEILGAGMVNPKVFEKVGYDLKKYTGFAFGMGVERIVMLKYRIDDIRLFFENDLRFLRQFYL